MLMIFSRVGMKVFRSKQPWYSTLIASSEMDQSGLFLRPSGHDVFAEENKNSADGACG